MSIEIENIKDLINSLNPDNGENAESTVWELEGLLSVVEDKIADIGVEHRLDISLGGYGNGRCLIIEENHWSGREVGEWLPSSETC